MACAARGFEDGRDGGAVVARVWLPNSGRAHYAGNPVGWNIAHVTEPAPRRPRR